MRGNPAGGAYFSGVCPRAILAIGARSRSGVIALLLGLCACGCLVAAAPALPASVAGKTRIVVYSPFTMNGTLSKGVKVIRSVSGSCWEGSLASARSDAWRCMSGNEILDPCYSGAAKWVACPRTAFGNRVVRLVLTKSLPRHGNKPLDTNRSDPAEIVLASGVTCGFSTGATGSVGGLRLNYGCTNGAWLAGDPDRTSTLWTILYLASINSSTLKPVSIATAWY